MIKENSMNAHLTGFGGRGYSMLDTGCSMLVTGYWMLDAGYWILDTGCGILDAGCRAQTCYIGYT
jgi:hypothetical protein